MSGSSGRGRGRGNQLSGRPGRLEPGVCFDFARYGRCNYGTRCKYPHGASAPTNQQAPARPTAAASVSNNRLAQYKRLLKRIGQGYTPDTNSQNTQSPFSLGLEILNEVEDAGAKQDVVTSLASEEGLTCIRHVVSRRIPRALMGSTAAKSRLWELEVCPLFRLVTHSSVTCSALLEEKVATIYSFLVGVGGARLALWFELVVELIEAADRPPQLPDIGLAELSLAVLSNMLNYSTSLSINETFRDFANRFIAVVAASEPSSPEDSFSKRQACQHISLISRRLKGADAIPGITPTLSNGFAGRLPTFQLRRDLPGDLSSDGPRHDNDHTDIAKISIMPTPEEISSTRDEYLPTIDASSWHLPGINGRLDREFRLLREDTVGQLRDVVRTELESLQQSESNGNGSARTRSRGGAAGRGKDSIRYCTYQDADLVDVDFDRRPGAEFLVQFRQPATQGSNMKTALESNSEAEARTLSQRRDWWMNRAKKRLQPNGLVCAIDAQGSALFFTVAESTMRTADDVKKYHPTGKKEDDKDEPRKKFTLADHPTTSFVRMALVSHESDDQLKDGLEWLFQSKQNRDSSGHSGRHVQLRVLVEFPGILLDSFLHTLKALQAGTQKLNIPFSDLIAPETDHDLGDDGHSGGRPYFSDGELSDIPPPGYAQKPGFVFDMGCLVSRRETLRHSLQDPLSSEEVHAKTKLDDTQSIALLEALSRSVALIQGPPGTGKTFAGVEILKVLLHNQKRAKLGPILIVCYTNHALDQLLEYVLDANDKVQMIRMGARSKSERLKNLNLREVAHNTPRTTAERVTLGQKGQALDDVTKELQILFKELAQSTSPKAIVRLLHRNHQEYYKQLFGTYNLVDDGGSDKDEDGFTTVRKKPDKTLLHWRNGGAPSTAHPSLAHNNQRPVAAAGRALSSLTRPEREVLYLRWQAEAFGEINNVIGSTYGDYVAAKKSYNQAMREVDLRCLMQANVVGVTTTGLARNLEFLKHLDAKVLLCEEAGEVLEAHMLTSLLPSLEHAILIGDHQQLRPQVQNYELRSDNPRGVQFSFDTSLFERLVSPPRADEARFPFSKLDTQRRMHPSISALIRAPLYPALQDGDNVQTYPGVPGMPRRLFWLQHQHLEQGASSGDQQADPTSTSRTNSFEVEMTAALVSHLFKQGVYSSGDIAVLTPYLGQMMNLQRRLSTMFELSFNERDQADLEAAADLDGTSDEENTEGATPSTAARPGKINKQNGKAIATAKTTLSNSVRIATVDNFQGEEAKVVVVSLVRSNEQRRCGFLSTSNRANVLLSRAKHGMFIIGNSDTCSGVPMWRQVISALEVDGNIGPQLPLQCPRHPERTFSASSPDHFAQFAPDGGCMLPCDKRLACGHACTGRCHSNVIHAAVKCVEPCPRPLKGCDHACSRPCGEPCVPKCAAKLDGKTLTLACGHTRKSPLCWQMQKPAAIRCDVLVQRTVPGCGHALVVACHKDVSAESFQCTAACGSALPCGHACGRTCSNCKTRAGGKIKQEDHGICTRPCGRLYGTCQHACKKECHGKDPCPPCTAPCEVRCSHSKCDLPCNEPCVPCAEETCASCCPHSACTMPCAAPCNWIPCSKRCAKRLACGHQCPSVCGEQCPDQQFCQQCGVKDALDQVVDYIMMATYAETDLDDDPCIFPSCGHILTMSSMDGTMEMGQHYTMAESASGNPYPVSLATSSLPFDMHEAKLCPGCRGSLRSVARYGRIVRRAVLDESTKRFISWARQQHEELAIEIMEEKKRLEAAESDAGRRAADGSGTAWRRFMKATGRAALIKSILHQAHPSRYGALVRTRDRISGYAQKVAKDEQPFQRVADLVRFAQRRRAEGATAEAAAPAPTPFVFNERVIQVGSHLKATLLLLRCDILALQDIASFLDKASPYEKLVSKMGGQTDAPSAVLAISEISKAFETNRFASLFQDCEAAIETARATKYIMQEVEGHIFYAQLCIAMRKLAGYWVKKGDAGTPEGGAAAAGGTPADGGQGAAEAGQDGTGKKAAPKAADFFASRAQLKDAGLAHVAAAHDIVAANLSTRLLKPELVSAEQALRELPFYQAVTADEQKAVYAAMAGEFRGSGHWYTCANGHPFTVGECGMPMEQARCPECGAAVGGHDHVSVAGVTRADAMEELGRDLHRLRV